MDLSDAIYELGFLFLGSTPPPPPYPDCGPDPTPDALDCGSYGDCGLFVTIESPPNLSVTSAQAVDVSGTVGSGAHQVSVNGVPAIITGGTYLAAAVGLVEGANRIAAQASGGADQLATASIQIVRDTTPPRVVITSPPDGTVVFSGSVTVSGVINDTITGAINPAVPRCTVAGTEVPVVNGGFSAPAVALEPGPNTIVVKVTDPAGNVGTAATNLTFDDTPARKIEVVSGNLQSAGLGAPLPQPLVARLLDESGNPVAGKPVIFRVSQSNGQFADGTRLLRVQSDGAGKAAADFTAGTRAGEGSNRVEATSPGFAGKAVFVSTSLGGAPARINVSGGTPQKGAVNTVLPEPLGTLVTDSGGNGVAGVMVQFRVTAGTGYFEPEGLHAVERPTDPAGRAAATFVLGSSAGVENNLVEATFDGLAGLPAVFVGSGLTPGKPADTTLSGLVLDHLGAPLPGVILHIEKTQLQVPSDDQGQFRLTGVPVGPVRLTAFGQSTPRPGSWPTLEYDLVTVSGVDNTLGMPIHLLPLQDESQVPLAGGDQEVVLTLANVPGFEIRIPAHSTSFAGVKRPGKVTVTQVRSDKVPMTPVDGTQPSLVLTLQPPSVRFDPPAPIAYPNTYGLGPGEMTEIYSFDHDLGRFVTIGPGTVTEDGMVIRSNPGFGVLKGGWQYTGPRQQTGDAGPCTVKVTSEDGPIACVGKPARFTARGGPGSGTMQWFVDGDAYDLPSNTSTSTLEIEFPSPKVRTVSALWTCASGEMKLDSVQVSVVTVGIGVNTHLVRLRSKVPDQKFLVGCVALVLGQPLTDVTVTIDCPDGKLHFITGDGSDSSTVKLVLPRTGSPVEFNLYGNSPSQSLDDAVMDVHLGPDYSGEICNRDKLTVFSLDPASIKVEVGGPYVLSDGVFSAISHAVDITAEATLKPSGLDCSAPQLQNLNIGIVQNAVGPVEYTGYWGNPKIIWNNNVPTGTTVMECEEFIRKTTIPTGLYNDTLKNDSKAPPLYDGSPGAIKRPMMCNPGAGTAIIDDNPESGGSLIRQAKDAGGNNVGTITYSLVRAKIKISFLDWLVCFDSTKPSEVYPLREIGWSVDVDSGGPPGQVATVDVSDSPPSHNPVLTGPYLPDLLADPKLQEVGTVENGCSGFGTHSFRK